MMKLRVSLGKIQLPKGQQPQPSSQKCLTDTVKGEAKAFSHIRPVRSLGQKSDEKNENDTRNQESGILK